MELHAVFRPGIDIPFSPTAFSDLEMGEGRSSEKSIVLDEKEDKENSSPTTPVPERPTEPPKLLRGLPPRRRTENVPEFVQRILFA